MQTEYVIESCAGIGMTGTLWILW